MWRGSASLQLAQYALNDVELFVDGFVVFVLDFAVLAQRDDGLGTAWVSATQRSFDASKDLRQL